VRHLYEQFSADEQHPLAQALRPHAKPSTLPGSPHAKELALQAMLDKDGEAIQRAERWRWQAVVRAELTDELRAVEALGTLQEKGGDFENAIRGYVRAGNAKKAKAAAGKHPDDHPARFDGSLLTEISPMRAAAFQPRLPPRTCSMMAKLALGPRWRLIKLPGAIRASR